MPLIQKIIQIGDSKAVTIPKSWLTFHERQNKHPIKEVTIEVNNTLVIRPIITLKEEEKNEK